ncbi:hypothetical protein [Kribbella sp. DT2]|uniref:hypothetical protein n=1 Tax=Kribbella sp. DT2 TaxID=3393427 RepID=UPI003CF684E8
MGTNRRYPREQPPGRHRRHCWVLATAHERGPWPGLILEWRRTNSGDWAARVVYVPNPHEHRSVEAWFASGLLRPIDSWPSRTTVDEAQHIDVHGA